MIKTYTRKGSGTNALNYNQILGETKPILSPLLADEHQRLSWGVKLLTPPNSVNKIGSGGYGIGKHSPPSQISHKYLSDTWDHTSRLLQPCAAIY